MCNHICVLGCTLQRDPPFASTTSCLITVLVLDSPRWMTRSEAARLMHVRVFTVVSDARVSARGASGETECRGVFGPISGDTKDNADEPHLCSCKLRARRVGLFAPRFSHHGGQLATCLTSLPKKLHSTHLVTQKIEHHPFHPHLQMLVFWSVPTRCRELVTMFTRRSPRYCPAWRREFRPRRWPAATQCQVHSIVPLHAGNMFGVILVRDTLWPKYLLRLRAPLQSTRAEGQMEPPSPRGRSQADRALEPGRRRFGRILLGRGEVVDPLLKVPRSRSTTSTLWLGQQRQLQLPSTPRYKCSLH